MNQCCFISRALLRTASESTMPHAGWFESASVHAALALSPLATVWCQHHCNPPKKEFMSDVSQDFAVICILILLIGKHTRTKQAWL